MELDVPAVNDYNSYHQFRGQSQSTLLAQAESQNIGASTSVPAYIRTKPVTEVHIKVPKPNHWSIFGWPIAFVKKAKENIFEFSGMTSKIPSLELS